ncbi:type II secretion system protein [Bacillus sp. BRMEA1]|uniref:competence type IV pilus minor pilin ComGD n=1 Tax=Neobacillus endophyticus TaxID=2738405 RepID=UPI001567471E|nr:competence type IV pilus minor pilin ComGD [Neobacillus endophyticus]NRD80738.1 type II secretion system protein [Neobacillus endophyticus]
MINDQKGFTLTESLVVFSIFLILTTVTVFSLKPQQTLINKTDFFTQFKADLYYAQEYAISHQHEVSVTIIPSEYKYYMYLNTFSPPIMERNYSHDLYLTEGSLPLYFKFLPDGNINKFGSIIIQSKNKTYRMTFLIGKGRFYVAES